MICCKSPPHTLHGPVVRMVLTAPTHHALAHHAEISFGDRPPVLGHRQDLAAMELIDE